MQCSCSCKRNFICVIAKLQKQFVQVGCNGNLALAAVADTCRFSINLFTWSQFSYISYPPVRCWHLAKLVIYLLPIFLYPVVYNHVWGQVVWSTFLPLRRYGVMRMYMYLLINLDNLIHIAWYGAIFLCGCILLADCTCICIFWLSWII